MAYLSRPHSVPTCYEGCGLTADARWNLQWRSLLLTPGASRSPFASRGVRMWSADGLALSQLGVTGNALKLHGVTFGSAVIKDLNLLDAALCEALYNVQSLVRIAREHPE
jgi:hypothetical protein